MTRRLVVVGGGIAGLAAAHEARHRGVAVTVLEAASTVGGKLRTSPFAGFDVDEGADAFLARVPWALELCEELGLADELVAPAVGVARVWLDGELRDLPREAVLGVPLDPDELARSAIVSSAAVEAVRADRARTRPLPADHGDSVSTFVRRRLGDEVFERLVGPLLGGINAGDVERLSLTAAVPQFAAATEAASLSRALEAARPPARGAPRPVFYAHPAGMGHLIDTLAGSLGTSIETDRAVTGLVRTADRWRVETATTVHEADGVVIATPAPAAASLLRPITGPTALDGIEHAGVVMVTFTWSPEDIGVDLDMSGFLVPPGTDLLLTAVTVSSTKWAHLHRDDQVIVRASAGRFGDPRALHLDDDELVTTLRRDLATTMAIEAEPGAHRVVRWPASFPQYTPGHLDRITSVENAVAASGDGLALAGAALRGVGIPACIRSGRDAVRTLLDG